MPSNERKEHRRHPSSSAARENLHSVAHDSHHVKTESTSMASIPKHQHRSSTTGNLGHHREKIDKKKTHTKDLEGSSAKESKNEKSSMMSRKETKQRHRSREHSGQHRARVTTKVVETESSKKRSRSGTPKPINSRRHVPRQRSSPGKERQQTMRKRILRDEQNDEQMTRKYLRTEDDKTKKFVVDGNHRSSKYTAKTTSMSENPRYYDGDESREHRMDDVRNGDAKTKNVETKSSKRSNKSSSPAITKTSAIVDEDFANLGFNSQSGYSAPSSNILFGNSGFANKDFSSTSNVSSQQSDQGRQPAMGQTSSSNKPRILPPQVSDGFCTGGFGKRQTNHIPQQQQGRQQNTFKIIVNELSEVSIKREEHPLKGTSKSARRPFHGGVPFSAQRGGRGGGTFGANQLRGLGHRDGLNSNRVQRSATNVDAFSNYSQQRKQPPQHPHQLQHTVHHQSPRSDSPPEASTKSVQSSVIVVNPPNPLSVPRGRNYFLHDARDDQSSDQSNTRRLYDPRLDRDRGGTDRRGSFISRGFRGRGGFIGRGGTSFGNSGPPMGWRNQFGNERQQQQQQIFSRGGTTAGLQRGAGNRGGGRGVVSQGTLDNAGPIDGYGGAEASLTGRPYWRSKADEDRVWSHDKFYEEEQEEQKLELVDEVVEIGNEEKDEPVTKLGGYEDLWANQGMTVTFGTRSKSRNREVKLDEETVFIDEDAEELMYD